ncbi:sn-glycerol-3-phosphate ABC transporter ATP-binding protein UgpC [Desulfosporosinus sp. FKA]|uniref:ABC transporter ATP-binding protein n=1 Tax=Desulfosporosinus sp. FKA TaxID=1969834 RepID=UPI000B49FA83|nr:sn-glycerol-3-phosphate ABC transporter ATP-binding protein UgpC [Desulfosporosinus sp. FKA]
MSRVSLTNVCKEYEGGVTAVSNFNLEIEDGEFIILVGSSGCGKSTTLRMIAGLEEITGGEIYIGDRIVNEVPPKDRDIAMVFQNYALYPHLSVYDNMAFGLKLRRIPKQQIKSKVQQTAEILGIEHLLQRKPKALSGGQKQRVALGRAIVREPQVFLLDEPLSNLDAKLRIQMRSEISRLHRDLGTTFIYVTHDQTEAMTMGTRIVVMKDGFIQQVDTPANLYEKPANLFVAGFIGSPPMNFLQARLENYEGGIRLMFGQNSLELPNIKARETVSGYTNREVVMGIRPENIRPRGISPKSLPAGNRITAIVETIELLGAETYLYLTLEDEHITARVNSKITAKTGDRLEIDLDPAGIHLFDQETEKAILHYQLLAMETENLRIRHV